MTNISKTLYIPLYGKAYVSKRALFLCDRKAEELWDSHSVPLKGKAKSKWLAFFLGIRAAVFDKWVKEQTANAKDAVVLHIGCGLDSRALRVDVQGKDWYDVDLPEVIDERRRHFSETEHYHMLAGDARDPRILEAIPRHEKAIVVMEGVSMYLKPSELNMLFAALQTRFSEVALLTDCYTNFAARMTKHRNPINEVGVSTAYGIDDPREIADETLAFFKEHPLTPRTYIDQLRGMEKFLFRRFYAGGLAKKLYRLYEYRTTQGGDFHEE